MAAPFVGFMVDKHWFHFGWGDYLFSFFSTVTGRLEKHWGERFPLIMNELCNNGRIRKEDVKQARKELRVIQQELKAFPPRAVIWDIERPDAVPFVSSHAISMHGLYSISESFDATIPITPLCQFSLDKTYTFCPPS